MSFSYIQWLWMTLKAEEVSVGTLNSAFSALHSILFVFNVEMLRKIPVGSLIALTAWYAPLSSSKVLIFIYIPGVCRSHLCSHQQHSSSILRTKHFPVQGLCGS
jgi:hypothetical protein